MKDTKTMPETPPLTRAGRKVADATLAAAKFMPTPDGKLAVRRFEVHGMVVTEQVSAADLSPASNPPSRTSPVSLAAATPTLKDSGPQTPPLTRQGRKIADATLAAAKFIPSSDGNGAERQFEVHGMVVTEKLMAEDVIPTPPQAAGAVTTKPFVEPPVSSLQTPPLSRGQRKIADATLAAAKFTPTSDGKSAIRKFDVHGISVTELVSADKAVGITKDRK